MNCATWCKQRRKGTIAVLTVFLAIPLFAMVAFAVDMAWICTTQAALQDAADNSAAAAAAQLTSGFVQFNGPQATGKATIISTSESSATTYATNFASYNNAGGVSSLTLVGSSDVQFGYTTSSGSYSTISGSSVYPNTVKVTVRRDSSANGALSLFFAPIMGIQTAALTATAAATIYTGSSVSSFNYSAGINGLLLPVAMDATAWATFYSTGASPDGTVHLGSNGLPQLQIYPSPGNAPGNFGLLSVGPHATSTPAYSTWIDDGPSPSDLQYLVTNSMVPVSESSPQAWDGGPGMKSSLSSDFASVQGQPRLIPIFEPVSTSPYQAANGNGSHTTYNIVGFVGVTITQATGNGSNMNISVQPSATVDPTVNYTSNSVQPAGEGSTSVTTMSVPKLTQ